jgi:serine/threonine protein kinase
VIGKTVLHYRILDLLGEGGMGVVYKAVDTKLDRPVALKFLSKLVVEHRQGLARFRQEAQTASCLNNPHICTIYGFEEDEGLPFIVMELLDGVPLKDLLSGPMKSETVVSIGIQIADALGAAHGKGIIHRDIKPANVFVSQKNHVKILDFGLSKSLEGRRVRYPAALPPGAPTLLDTTLPGNVVGTVAYMSPEQARGEGLDSRTDLFSFGSVLYEMITGRRAFDGATPAVVFDGILHKHPPPPSRFNSEMPAEMDAIVNKLLQKDRTLRYQTADDVWTDLSRLKREMDSAETVILEQRSKRAKWITWALLGGLLAATVYGAVTLLNVRQNNAAGMTFMQITTQHGAEFFPSLSPDGRSIVYASDSFGNWDINLQRVGGQNAINLTKDSPSDDTQPAFSPGGESIAFRSERDGGGIYIMGATGESVRRLTDFGYNPSWSPDGLRIVFSEESVVDSPRKRTDQSVLWIVALETGKAHQISKADGVQPHWSPHGQRIAYWAHQGGNRDIWTIRPDGTDPVRVTHDSALDWNPVWSSDGQYLYFSSDRAGNTNLWRVRLDETSGRVLEPFEPVTTGGGTAQRMHTSMSAGGTQLAYVEQVVTEDLFRISFDPVAMKVSGEATAVTKGLGVITDPDVSPDGHWLAYEMVGVHEDIVISRSDGSGEVRLTNDAFRDRVPRWSPDGNRIAFYSNRTGNYQVWMINRNGSDLQQVTNDPIAVNRSVWSPDGKHLACCHDDGSCFIIDADATGGVRSRKTLPDFDVPNEQFDLWSWSPDQKWLAGRRLFRVGSVESRGLVLFSLQSQTYRTITSSGQSARWLKGGSRLLFLDEGKLRAVDTRSGAVSSLLSLPLTLNSLALSPDNRTLYFSGIAHEADIWLITQDSR